MIEVLLGNLNDNSKSCNICNDEHSKIFLGYDLNDGLPCFYWHCSACNCQFADSKLMTINRHVHQQAFDVSVSDLLKNREGQGD